MQTHIRLTRKQIEASIIFVIMALCPTISGLAGQAFKAHKETEQEKPVVIKIEDVYEPETEPPEVFFEDMPQEEETTELYSEPTTERSEAATELAEKSTSIAVDEEDTETTTKKEIEVELTTSAALPKSFITDDEYDYICHVVMGEAGSDGWESMVAVAQCYKNAMKKENVSAYKIKTMYGYAAHTNNTPTKEVKEAVYKVFYEDYGVTTEPILYYYAPKYSSGSWHQTQTYVGTWGTQRFYKANGT